MADWIPSVPNAYLKDNQRLRAYGDSVQWQSDFAQWRHTYCPGIELFVGTVFGGMSTTSFQRLLKPLVPVAAAIIPSPLTTAVRPVQPDDWTKLPADQIEDAYNNKNPMVFSKLVLLLVGLQIAVFRRLGVVDSSIPPSLDITDPDGGSKPVLIANPDFVQRMQEIEAIGALNVFERLKFHVACYSFAPHDAAWWIENVVQNDARLTTFSDFTHQKKKGPFPRSFANGDLCTLQTLINIAAWRAEHFPTLPLGQIRYADDDGPHKAAKREVVFEEVEPAER